MQYEEKSLLAAHKKSSFHRKELYESNLCGCFYCQMVYKPNEIEEWTDGNDEDQTALCPKCGIDSVIGSASGYPVEDKEFLKAMHKRWFL